MKHMNSVYVHCDLVLFIETELPKVDETLHTATIESPTTSGRSSWIRFKLRVRRIQMTDHSSMIVLSSVMRNRSYGRRTQDTYRPRCIVFETTVRTTQHILNDDRGWLFLNESRLQSKQQQQEHTDLMISYSRMMRNYVS